MTKRALELMCLPEKPCFLLDIGCGTGISGEVLSSLGHYWIGLDISPDMLNVALSNNVCGDLLWQDMGQGMAFRPGTFDGVISISALQWLCNSDWKENNPKDRLYSFFVSLYKIMSRGSQAVFQLYPENSQQMELITQSALRSGFGGGTVIDYPNSSKAKKVFLVLSCGSITTLPVGLADQKNTSSAQFLENKKEKHKKTKRATRKEYIMHKKERQRKQGNVNVRMDSKYTGRKRKIKW